MQFWIDLFKSGFGRSFPEDRITGKPSGPQKVNGQFLMPYLKNHWRKGLIGAGVILLTAALGFVNPLLTRFLVDHVILAKHLEWLIWTVLGLAAVKGLTVGGGMLEQVLFSQLRLDVEVEMQQNLLEHTLKLPKAFFDDTETGYLMSRVVSDIQGVTWFFSQTAVYIFTNLLRFVGGLIFVFVLEWRLALVAVIALPLLYVIVAVFSKRMNVLSYNSMEQHATVTSRLQETLANVPLIKAFATEDKETKRVISEVKSARQISLEQTVVGSVAGSLINLIPDIAKGVVLLAGAYLVIKGNWTLGSLLAFQSYLGYIYGPALSLSSINLELQNALAALDRVSSLMKIVPEENSGAGIQVDHLQGDVRFEHVSFSYDGIDRVLEEINFRVKPGERIAIIGPSGVGKSTLIQLMLRFYKPTSGELFFDGLPADNYELSSLRHRIGYVAQSTLLLEGTFRQALLYGRSDVPDDEIWRVLKVAGLAEYIDGLPAKLDSRIGEKGVNLSEGQKQRLSIARALIKDPDILIMDEPTSALDSLLEKSIFEALPHEAEGKTLIVAAHRLTTIQNADRIIILKDRHITGMGTHQELIDTNEYYQHLFP